MQLTYRGVRYYRQNNNSTFTIISDIPGKFLGQSYYRRRPLQSFPKRIRNGKYRGKTY